MTTEAMPAQGPVDVNVRDSSRVSIGRNPNTQDCCGYPKCAHLKVDGDKSFGWCQHPDNRVQSEGWPNGFAPSVSFTGYCDHHTAATPNAKVERQPPHICKYCGNPSWYEPSEQTPPPDYCHESDHGSDPGEER